MQRLQSSLAAAVWTRLHSLYLETSRRSLTIWLDYWLQRSRSGPVNLSPVIGSRDSRPWKGGRLSPRHGLLHWFSLGKGLFVCTFKRSKLSSLTKTHITGTGMSGMLLWNVTAVRRSLMVRDRSWCLTDFTTKSFGLDGKLTFRTLPTCGR